MKRAAKAKLASSGQAEMDDEGKSIVGVDYEAGASRFSNGDDFHGTAVLYAVRDGDHISIQCDYELKTMLESNPHDVRAFRQDLK